MVGLGHCFFPLLHLLCGILNSILFTGVGKNDSKRSIIGVVWGNCCCHVWKRYVARQISFQPQIVLSLWFNIFGFFRLAASYLLGACILVLNSVLRIESKSGRNLPCLAAFPDCRWLYRSIEFGTFLSRSAFQCEQKCYSGNDKATHR